MWCDFLIKFDNQRNCLSESLNIVTSNNSLWQSQELSVTIIIYEKNLSNLPSLLRPRSFVLWTPQSLKTEKSHLLLDLWSCDALMMHLRRVRVGAMKVKVPPCTIGSRHPKVLWWELFRTKLVKLQWSIEATMRIVTPARRWQFQIQRELCTEYNSEQGRPPSWR